jgi:quercetin dioxygenase-like cupin family protein/alkylhydroperoxidase/carboxymuconolactone decarboxylase family protein YurZ
MKKIIAPMIVTTFFCLNTKAQKSMDEKQLNSKEQSIVKIASLTATGNIDALKMQLSAGLDAGLTVNEVKEVLIQLYAYCGFPRSLNAINALMTVLEERKNKGITDTQGREASLIPATESKYEVGKKTLQALTKREETQLTGANAFAPAIDTFLKEHLFADIFSRDVLTYQQRELATISALASMPGVEPQLKAHVAIGQNTSITENQLAQVFSLVSRVTDAGAIFPKGNPLPNTWFSGNAFLTPLVARDKNNEFVIGCVTFEPNARTHWHTHPKGQVLIVIEGSGLYQEKGKPARHIKVGDIVTIPDNVEHWHGATATSKMAHIAITNYKGEENVTWLQPVNDEQYKLAN